MSTPALRARMSKDILGFEARRDHAGRLSVYRLPPGDGGGTYEVAGINDRYHPEEARHLSDLIEGGRFSEAEAAALELIAARTDFAAQWTSHPGLEFYLRDCGFNRGPRGAARILQRAVGVVDDGIVGVRTREAMLPYAGSEKELIARLRTARETYEREVAGRNESSPFWQGLCNRWDKALAVAVQLGDDAGSVPADTVPGSEAPFQPALEATKMLASADVASRTVSLLSSIGALPGGPVETDVPPPESRTTIRALRLGSEGSLVRAWQSFLHGQGLDPGELDGYFGEKTIVATQAFQSRMGLQSDGVAGRQTLLRAAASGFELVEEPDGNITGSNFPPRPDFPPLVGNSARAAVFGRFDYVSDPAPGNRERIRIVGDWEQDNIEWVPIPQLQKALGASAPAGMRFHRLASRQLADLWADWEDSGLIDRILTFEGSFVPRFVRGSRSVLSNHAFGSAFDINYRWNKLGARPALIGEPGSVRELVPAAIKHGFYWGGFFSARLDGMHFEIAHVVTHQAGP